jgi:hypothetical protein
MEVHVPQAGYQELAGGIDHPGARRRRNSLSNRSYAPIGDGEGNIYARRRAGCVDYGSMLEEYVLS